MAQKLETYDWDKRPAPRRRYDWPNWLDGHIWRICSGEDYNVKTENMRVTLHDKGKAQGQKCRVRKVPQHDDPEYGQWEGLVFQYYEE